MQTRPVAALALGTMLGSTKTIDRTRKISGRIVLDFFKYVHYGVNNNREIRVSEGGCDYPDQHSGCFRKHLFDSFLSRVPKDPVPLAEHPQQLRLVASPVEFFV